MKEEIKNIEELSKKEEWGGWKFVSDMLDKPNEHGIYPTGECYKKLYDFVVEQKSATAKEIRERIEKMGTYTTTGAIGDGVIFIAKKDILKIIDDVIGEK